MNKIDFAVIMSCYHCNPNGDPNNRNMPRTDIDGYGYITDVCLKRKIRNRLQDMGQEILLKTNDRTDDGFYSIKSRSDPCIKGIKDRDEVMRIVCEKWIDVRSFGLVLAFKGKETGDGVSLGIRGPVTIQMAVSTEPVMITYDAITKSLNAEDTDKENLLKKGKDTMGIKVWIDKASYVTYGTISSFYADKTGFNEADAELIKKALCTLFENDASVARPSGSMEVQEVYWWKHNCKSGQYNSAKVHHSLNVEYMEEYPYYKAHMEPLEGLIPEIIRP